MDQLLRAKTKKEGGDEGAVGGVGAQQMKENFMRFLEEFESLKEEVGLKEELVATQGEELLRLKARGGV